MTLTEEDRHHIQLLSAIAHRDQSAFQTLYRLTSPRLFGLCMKLLHHQERAEEALQEAYIRIWHHADEYHEERGTPLNWMLTIARYRALDLIRQAKTRGVQSDDGLEQVADFRSGPLEHSLATASASALDGCLEELSPDQRNTILLSYYRGFTQDDLTQALDKPLGTIKSWIRRGLKSLKRCLER